MSFLICSRPEKLHQKMMQPNILLPTCPSYNGIYGYDRPVEYNGLTMDPQLTDASDLFSIFTEFQDFPSPSLPSKLDFLQPVDFDQVSAMEGISMEFPGLEQFLTSETMQHESEEESWGSLFSSQVWIQGEGQWSPTPSNESSNAISTENSSSLTIPEENMEVDNRLGVLHLLKAYGEAKEKDQKELAEVIQRCLGEKINPAGEALERLAYLTTDRENSGDYMTEESAKNFEAAFMAFYQMFPYGIFAHFAANSAIIGAVPDDAQTIHVVDFDVREGVQWPPVIEAIARRRRRLKLTAVKWGDEEHDSHASLWRFEETRRKLLEHAKPFGLKLEIEEKNIEDLVDEMKKLKRRNEGRDWVAFNCMFKLPHMGMGRSRRRAMEFLSTAKDFLVDGQAGILCLGDGNGCRMTRNYPVFETFFEEHLAHYQALLESMESIFPAHLAEARTAMETLFVAPAVSSHKWLQNWNEMTDKIIVDEPLIGLVGRCLSGENVSEIAEMVRKEEANGIRMEVRSSNEMVLEWKGTPLVRLSTWGNQR